VLLRRSALDNVRYALQVGGSPARERHDRAYEALCKVGLEAQADRPARVLSGGEQQRLALARVWALRPEILFLDEPTASLDPGATHEIEKVIPRAAPGRDQDRDGDAQPRAGAAARRRNPVPVPGQVAGTPACRPVSQEPASSEAARFLEGELPVVAARRIFLALLLVVAAGGALAHERFITVRIDDVDRAVGTLWPHLPIFEKETGIKVRIVALGTGQALDLARRGDADVVFVHAKAAEKKFVSEGYGVRRFPVMYNDFVLIGPKSDPAKCAGGKDITEALKKIQSSHAPFVPAATRAARTWPSSNCGTSPESTSTR
jgi:hypothetical protein